MIFCFTYIFAFPVSHTTTTTKTPQANKQTQHQDVGKAALLENISSSLAVNSRMNVIFLFLFIYLCFVITTVITFSFSARSKAMPETLQSLL